MFRPIMITTLLGLTLCAAACGEADSSLTGTPSASYTDSGIPGSPSSDERLVVDVPSSYELLVVDGSAADSDGVSGTSNPSSAKSTSAAPGGTMPSGNSSAAVGGATPTGNVSVAPTVSIPADPAESLVMMASTRKVSTKFFGISAWETPFHSSAIGAPKGSYGIARYCAYNASVPNAATELTYLASGAASYDGFNTWVDYHRARDADVMVQVYINSFGSATTLSPAQWDFVKTKYEQFLTNAAGRVKYVLLANEPLFAGTPGDNPREATSAGWPSRSASLYAQYARVIKQISAAHDRSIKVIGPEIMSLDSFRVSSAIAAMETSAAGPDVGYGNGAGTKMKDWIDIFGFHGYHYTGGTFAPVDGGFSLINALKAQLKKIGFAGPIWQTEFMRTSGGEMFNSSWNTIVEQIARRHAAEVAAGVEHSTNFEWGSSGPHSYFNDDSARGEAARSWWVAYTNWWRAAPIGRIAQLSSGKLKVTREDGKALLIPDNLFDGTLAPNP